MPSPRAVLADIHDNKLDPTVAHSNPRAHGRLVQKAVPAQEPVVEQKPKKAVVVEAPPLPPPPPPVETTVEPTPVEPVDSVQDKKQVKQKSKKDSVVSE